MFVREGDSLGSLDRDNLPGTSLPGRRKEEVTGGEGKWVTYTGDRRGREIGYMYLKLIVTYKPSTMDCPKTGRISKLYID